MLATIFLIAVVYFVLLTTVNILLGGKATVTLISWFKLFGLRFKISGISISIGSIQCIFKPWNIRSLESGIFAIRISNMHVDLSTFERSNSIKTQKTDKQNKDNSSKDNSNITKILSLLKQYSYLFPFKIEIVKSKVFNGSKFISIHYSSASLDFNNVRETENLAVGFHLLFDSVRANNTKNSGGGNLIVSCEVTDNLSFKKFMIQGGGRNNSIDIVQIKEVLQPLLGKKDESFEDGQIETYSEVIDIETPKKDLSLLELYDKHEIESASISLEGLELISGDMKIVLETFKLSFGRLLHEVVLPNVLQGREIYEVLLGLTSLKVLHATNEKSYVYLPSLNISSIADIKDLLTVFDKMEDEEFIRNLANDDRFLLRTIVPVNNITFSSSLEDTLKFAEENLSRPKGSKKVSKRLTHVIKPKTKSYSHLIMLLPKIRTRVQLLSSTFFYELTDELTLSLRIEDILFDTSISDSYESLFVQTDKSLFSKLIVFFIRDIQLHASENGLASRLFAMDYFESSLCAAFKDSKPIINLAKLHINSIEVLFEELSLFQKLYQISKSLQAANHSNEVTTGEIEEIEDNEIEDNDQILNNKGESSKKQLLPELIHKFEFKITSVKLISCFANPVKYYNGVDQSELNSYKRGLSLCLEKAELSFDNSVEQQKLEFKLGSLLSNIITDYEKQRHANLFDEFFSLKDFQLKYFSITNKLSVILPIVDIVISTEALWSVVFVSTILASVIPKSKHKKTKKVVSKKSDEQKSKLTYLIGLHLLMIQFKLPSNIDLVIELDSLEALPTVEDDAYVRFRALRLYGVNPHVTRMWSLIAIFCDASVLIKLHELVGGEPRVTVNSRSARFEIPFEYLFFMAFDNIKSLIKSYSKIKKNFKNLMDVEESDKDFKVDIILPSMAEKPFRCPKIKVHTKQFQFCMHDDPFENELNTCFLAGKLDQKLRMVKLKEFQLYEERFRKELEEKYTSLKFVDGVAIKPESFENEKLVKEKIQWSSKHTAQLPKASQLSTPSSDSATQSIPAPRSRKFTANASNGNLVSSPITSKLANEVPSQSHEEYSDYLADVHQGLEIPKARLLSNLSKSWIVRIKAIRELKQKNYAQKLLDTRGGDDPPVSKEFMKKYPVISAYCIAPLFSFDMVDLDWIFDEPEFGLDNYPDFMYKIASGQPKDTEYGILFPVNLSISCSKLSVQIRDFILPLISFGGAHNDAHDAVILKGDFVITEQMYTPEELRYNFVPLVSQYHDEECRDSLYAAHVSRTMTDVKFSTDMKVSVTSHVNAVVTWFPSMQPALGYAIDSFDVLSKPPLDTSPKVGFWDKMCLLVQSRFDFNFRNGIHLFIKGDLSPYGLASRSAGFVFRWNDNANLKINSTGNPADFLIVESKSFEIAIPSFEHFHVDSLISGGKHDFGTNYAVHKKVLKLKSDPVVWKMGFKFERNLNNEKIFEPGSLPRSSVFVPHYDVRLRNPSSFKTEEDLDNWDAYEGFRTQYLHMAISLVSKDVDASFAKSYNSTHLSPLTFSHFFEWWNMFGSSLGLPIKKGKIFKNKFMVESAPSESFGKTLSSISYMLDIQPLYLTHVYRHAASLKANSQLAFTGLKASVKRFSMDLHQTKSEVPMFGVKNVSEEDGPKTEWKLKFKKGEIDFLKTDLRLLTAQFDEVCAAGILAKAIGMEAGSSSSNYENSSSSTSDQSRDNSADIVWYDDDDFVELESPRITSKNPRWRALPFASSPRFSYFKDEADDELDYPFDSMQAKTHACLLGKNHPQKTLLVLANTRADDLKEQIMNHQATLDSLQSNSKAYQAEFVTKKVTELEDTIQDLDRRLHLVRLLKDDFMDGKIPAHDDLEGNHEVSDIETTYSISRMNSRLSRTSSGITSASKNPAQLKQRTSSFRNRFIVYSMLLRWSPYIRKRFIRYIDNVGERRSLVFNLSTKAIKLAEDLHRSQFLEKSATGIACENIDDQFESSFEMFNDFDKYLHDTGDLKDVTTDDTYLFKFILPQLRVDNDTDSCVLVAPREIVLSSITVNSNHTSAMQDPISAAVETRNGIALYDAFFFVFEKNMALNDSYKFFHYDSTHCWPPRLPIEMYYYTEALRESIVVQKISCGLIFIKPNRLHYSEEDNFENKCFKEVVRVLSPEVYVTANTRQHEIIYNVIMSLIKKTDKTEQQKTKDRVSTLVKFSDTEDFLEIARAIGELQEHTRLLLECRSIFLVIEGFDKASRNSDVTMINVELEKLYLQLGMMVSYLQQTKATKYNDSYDQRQFLLAADYIKLELLDNDYKNFVNIEATNTYYLTDQTPDGASGNRVVVDTFIAEDLQENAKYKTIIERYGPNNRGKPMAFVDWLSLEPVNGIPIVEHKFIALEPVKIEVDYKTAKALYEFLYPKSIKDHEDTDDTDSFNSDDSDDESSTFSSESSSFMTGSSTPGSRFDTYSSSSASDIVSSSNNRPKNRLSRRLSKLKIVSKARANSSSSSTKSDGSPSSSLTKVDPSSVSFSKSVSKPKDSNAQEEEYISQMVGRAKLYQLLNKITINPIVLCLSFHGQGSSKLIDVTRLVVDISKVEYKNKVWSDEDFFQHLKKEIFKVVLKHTGKIIGNKLKVHKNSENRLRLPGSTPKTSLERNSAENSRKPAAPHVHHSSIHQKMSRFQDPDILEPVSKIHSYKEEPKDIGEDSEFEVKGFQPMREIREE